MGKLAKQYGVASRGAARGGQALGVEFIPCQMTMDMFGLKREDLIEAWASRRAPPPSSS